MSTPVLAQPIADQLATESSAFTFTLPSGTFTDAHPLTYTATLSNGSALPSWLTFNALTQTFSGTPTSTSQGILTVRVTASDGTLSNYDDFLLDVANLLTGGTGNDSLVGEANTIRDLIYGLDGNDTLNGNLGVDTMVGGAGNDSYVVDNTGDVVTENPSEGNDIVSSSITYSLPVNVETLILTGTSAIDGTGNDGANWVKGNSGNNSLTGGLGNDTLEGLTGTDTLVGGAGNDTYVISDAVDTPVEQPGEGTDTAQSAITYSLPANIENLVLSGYATINGEGNSDNNLLRGNAVNNSLSGGIGNDTLDAATVGNGTDTLIGGADNDTYIIGDLADVISENANEGTDTVQTTISYTLPPETETLILTGTAATNGTGNGLPNLLRGNTANNSLIGGVGNDTLDAGTAGNGTDTLMGGADNDTYVISDLADVITEQLNQGTDIVQSSISYTLPPEVENLVLTGAASLNGVGNTLPNLIRGNSGDNSLVGDIGKDTLDGGIGNDTLTGGTDDDTYIVSDINNQVVEQDLQGTDIIQSSVTYSLPNYVETLVLTGTDPINGTGNSLDNLLRGNTGNNSLIGGTGNDTLEGGETGSGTDTLDGGVGNDTYIIADSTDIIIEQPNSGNDTVQNSASFTLFADVENLVLTGTASINGTGNDVDNLIRGNTGNNSLAGAGGNDTLDGGTTGSGTDTLAGGIGNDIYLISDATDIITEQNGEGTDAVQSTINYSLPSLVEVENLILLGTDPLNGTGNEFNNLLRGNANNNSLDGGVGNDTLDSNTGNDTLAGGLGDDTYLIGDLNSTIIEQTGGGIDNAQSSISYTLPDQVETLTLISGALDGSGNVIDNLLQGNSNDNNLFGNAGNDTLNGGAGNDTLNGGSGIDFMAGGTGNDLYYVDETSDVTDETGGNGTDKVFSSVTYSLSSSIENLELTGNSNIDGTGNGGNNNLIGNNGNNILDGLAGDDTMAGGYGNDIYYIDSANDVVTETASGLTGGADGIVSSIDYTLPANVEGLALIGSTATIAVGNDLNNAIAGNDLDNLIDGGLGADNILTGLTGGKGNDTYIVDDAGDEVTEYPNEGTADLVKTSVDFDLPADVENLTLLGNAIRGGGNSLHNLITGNTLDNILNGGAGNDTLVGGSGNDTYTVDSASDVITENLGEGNADLVNSSVTFTLPSEVENLTLTGNSAINSTGNDLANYLTGNSANNSLNGGIGNDTLAGGAGSDTLVGGAGDDTYIVDSSDSIIETGIGGGIDTVISVSTYTLPVNVENLVLSGTSNVNGTGNADNNIITGNSGSNILLGDIGDDTLNGDAGNDALNGGTGIDSMTGGTGDDTYYVENNNDVIVEALNGGLDSVNSSAANYSLSAEVENLTLTGTSAINGQGNDLANLLTGNTAANSLTGGAGNDTLTGGGGNDTLAGGQGDDTYILGFSGASTTISENSSQGNDTILSKVSYTLPADVENLTFVLDSTSSYLSATGNGLPNTLIGDLGSNRLYGNGGNDTLNGGAGNDILDGGTGVDSMTGGTGDDSYYIDDATDVIIENVGGGIDTVYSSVNGYSLIAEFENLTLTGSAVNGIGNSADNYLTGNSLNNSLTGGAGNDTLNGLSGADTMTGGSGNDTYIVDNTSDAVTELGGGGTADTISSSVTYTLPANVENLTLTGSSSINGTGNTGINVIIGNNYNNILDGGVDSDSLTGNTGNDVFVFKSGEANGDTITDFTGNGSAAGDSLKFIGFGAGATLTYSGTGYDWNINGTTSETITITGVTSLDPSDYIFV